MILFLVFVCVCVFSDLLLCVFRLLFWLVAC